VSVTFYATTHQGVKAGEPVNLANGNAALVLDRLGLPADLWGECPAADFGARCLLGTVGYPDDGMPAATYRHPTMATLVDAGLRPGYFTDVLARLADLAAAAPGGTVHWA